MPRVLLFEFVIVHYISETVQIYTVSEIKQRVRQRQSLIMMSDDPLGAVSPKPHEKRLTVRPAFFHSEYREYFVTRTATRFSATIGETASVSPL